MASRLEGKVAFITGAARGQGRAHAIRMAEEGANIIAVDICGPIESTGYPLASPEDLAETERAVKDLGRRIIAGVADVRERADLREVLEVGVTDLGSIDVVVANAGICPVSGGNPKPMDFVDATDVDLLGVMNTVAVALPHVSRGGSIIVTGSTAGMIPGASDNPVLGPGGSGYGWSKRDLISYVEKMALHLADQFIRVNAMHPTNCNTHLLHQQGLYNLFRPDVAGAEDVSREDAELAFVALQAMPIPYVEPEDVANLALFLASDESRYVTGQQIRVDAGALLKIPDGPAT